MAIYPNDIIRTGILWWVMKFFCRLNSFYTMAVYTEACVESQFSGVAITMHAFYNVHAGQRVSDISCFVKAVDQGNKNNNYTTKY